jgi:hypothetical protein
MLPQESSNLLSVDWAKEEPQRRFIFGLTGLFNRIATQFNALQKGSIDGRYTAAAAPTAGTWKQGDIVYHNAPVEAGIATAKYVQIGWICSVSGTPGTWLQMRVLTGN